MPDTITLSPGEKRTETLSGGDSFTNTLVDMSAEGAEFHIGVSGNGWVIRNVGIKGKLDDPNGHPNIVRGLGQGVIENCYFGDLGVDGVGCGAIGINSEHAGHIKIVNCFIGGATDNGIYAAQPAQNNNGTIAVDGCFLQNNNISHIRIAADGSTVKNTVITNTSNVRANQKDNGINSRGLYDGYGDGDETVTIENCHINVHENNTNGAAAAAVAGTVTYDIRNSQVRGRLEGNIQETSVGSEPKATPPSAVPTSASAAANGTSGGGSVTAPGPGGGSGGENRRSSGGNQANNSSGVQPFEIPAPYSDPEDAPEKQQYAIVDDASETGTVEDPAVGDQPDSGNDTSDDTGPDTSPVVIAGIALPGTTSLTKSGKGFKSQYLQEVQAGTGEKGNPYNADSPPPGENSGSGSGSGTGSSSSGSGDQGKVPPKTLSFRVLLGSETYRRLEQQRKQTGTFTARIGEKTYDNMEFAELSRSQTDEENLYDVSISIQERRKYRIPDSPTNRNNQNNNQNNTGGRPPSGSVRTISDPQVPVSHYNERGQQQPPPVNEVGSFNESISGGESINNVLCNGQFQATTRGSGWAVRNVGVGGTSDLSGNTSEPFVVEGDGIIEHCYFGEGSTDVNNAGVYVHNDHSGTILIRFCYFEGWQNGGIYGSGPGINNGGGGTIIVENCYFANNGIANIRLGTNGSGFKNCVAHSPSSHGGRNIWAYSNNTKGVNSDLGGRLVIGEDAHPEGLPAKLMLDNCRWNGQGGVDTVGGSTATGTDAAQSGSPTFAVPQRVPQSPSEAANGTFYSRPPGGSQ